jgi:hypothetical protein
MGRVQSEARDPELEVVSRDKDHDHRKSFIQYINRDIFGF